jgi:hypothetical protein
VEVGSRRSQGVGETAQEMVEWGRLTSTQITAASENLHVSCNAVASGKKMHQRCHPEDGGVSQWAARGATVIKMGHPRVRGIKFNAKYLRKDLVAGAVRGKGASRVAEWVLFGYYLSATRRAEGNSANGT